MVNACVGCNVAARQASSALSTGVAFGQTHVTTTGVLPQVCMRKRMHT